GRLPGGRRADVLHCAQPLHAASGWHPGAADRPRRPTRTAACTALPVAAAPAGMACAVPVVLPLAAWPVLSCVLRASPLGVSAMSRARRRVPLWPAILGRLLLPTLPRVAPLSTLAREARAAPAAHPLAEPPRTYEAQPQDETAEDVERYRFR